MQIITNNQPRPIIYWHELTSKEKQGFDYLTEEEEANDSSFFRYKGWVYCLGEFMRDGTPAGWDGVSAQSAFDAVLVKIVDNEAVIVGRAFW